jgi:hypothetical protein
MSLSSIIVTRIWLRTAAVAGGVFGIAFSECAC